MNTINNPRFPHTCRVFRLTGVSSVTEGSELTVLYEGICRKYKNYFDDILRVGNMDANTTTDCLSIPAVFSILVGDHIEGTDKTGTFEGRVSDWDVSNLGGMTIYFKSIKN